MDIFLNLLFGYLAIIGGLLALLILILVALLLIKQLADNSEVG